ncbi:hypothetical protein HZS_834, partial [Henneguya salminicola]
TLAPTLTSFHGKDQVGSVPNDLLKARYKRCESATRSLDGSYRVIEHGSKLFRVDLGGRFDIVSVDRLKPAYVMQENESTLLEGVL